MLVPLMPLMKQWKRLISALAVVPSSGIAGRMIPDADSCDCRGQSRIPICRPFLSPTQEIPTMEKHFTTFTDNRGKTHNMLTVDPGKQWPFSFGVSKAQAIAALGKEGFWLLLTEYLSRNGQNHSVSRS